MGFGPGTGVGFGTRAVARSRRFARRRRRDAGSVRRLGGRADRARRRRRSAAPRRPPPGPRRPAVRERVGRPAAGPGDPPPSAPPRIDRGPAGVCSREPVGPQGRPPRPPCRARRSSTPSPSPTPAAGRSGASSWRRRFPPASRLEGTNPRADRDGETLLWSFPVLAAGAEEVISVRVTPERSGVIGGGDGGAVGSFRRRPHVDPRPGTVARRRPGRGARGRAGRSTSC